MCYFLYKTAWRRKKRKKKTTRKKRRNKGEKEYYKSKNWEHAVRLCQHQKVLTLTFFYLFLEILLVAWSSFLKAKNWFLLQTRESLEEIIINEYYFSAFFNQSLVYLIDESLKLLLIQMFLWILSQSFLVNLF